ncbi:MAG TPA: 2-(1,2-epoxy-1,2-dihydrophenyl)acetyl-CoA isomerase, partial [Afipia sp.]|nr:2-(1,2-epoxy-1,2-dihydrophenyl)acetyl-CoA isomerase [Afipia sp.]
MDKDLVLTEIRDGYRVITLNRPGSLNSFNQSVHTALNAALNDAEADTKCRALILTG